MWTEKCDKCGRFLNPKSDGVAGAEMRDGLFSLGRPRYRCPACNAKHGFPKSNCENPERFEWQNVQFVPDEAISPGEAHLYQDGNLVGRIVGLESKEGA